MHGTDAVSLRHIKLWRESFLFVEIKIITIIVSNEKFMINRLEALVEMAPIDKKARIHMLGDFIQGREKIIEDPFYVS